MVGGNGSLKTLKAAKTTFPNKVNSKRVKIYAKMPLYSNKALLDETILQISKFNAALSGNRIFKTTFSMIFPSHFIEYLIYLVN